MNSMPLKVLLIEDNPGDARLIHEMLKEARSVTFDLEVVHSLSDGFSLLKQRRYDAILLDLGLPESSGLETLQRLVRQMRDHDPIVVLTGLEDEEVGMAAVQLGAQDYLQKSTLNSVVLSRSLHYAIERNRTDSILKLQGAALQAAANAILITDEKGVIEWANPAFTELTGYALSDVLGKTPRILKSGSQAAAVYDELWQTALSGNVWQGELVNQRKDGTLYTEEMTITPVLDRDGSPSNFIAVKRDISQRKKAEADLQAANELLQSLNQVIAIGSTSLDPGTVLRNTSQYLGDVLGMPEGAAVLIDHDKNRATICAAFGAEAQNSLVGMEISLQYSSLYDYINEKREFLIVDDPRNSPLVRPYLHLLRGNEINSMVLVPLFLQEKLVGVIAFGSNEQLTISGEESALINAATQFISQALENSLLHEQIANHNTRLADLVSERTSQLEMLHRRTFTIVNNVSEAIMLLDADHTVVSINRACERIFGYAEDEVVDSSVVRLFQEEDSPRLLQELESLTEESPFRQLEVFGRNKGGNSFDAGIAFALVMNDHNQVVCSVRDISHLKEAERLKDQFVSTVNHELRTPIAAISLLAESSSRYYERMSPEQRKQKIDLIYQQTKVLNELIVGILNIAQFDSKQQRNDRELVDFDAMYRAAVTEIRPSIESKRQTLRVFHGESEPAFVGAEDELRLIWRNLLGNANKYTGEGGEIEARWGVLSKNIGGATAVDPSLLSEVLLIPDDLSAGEYVIGQVCDTGNGIPPEEIDQIFARFYRGWAQSSNIPGTGIGLALVKEILSGYGGGIRVESQVGVGSTFVFWIPIGHKMSLTDQPVTVTAISES